MRDLTRILVALALSAIFVLCGVVTKVFTSDCTAENSDRKISVVADDAVTGYAQVSAVLDHFPPLT